MDFAAFFMTFLSDDWVFFQEGEITWDGKRHAINGLQVNAAKVDGFMPFISENSDFDNIKEALDYFVAFLTNIETDEEFAIPRSSIAPGVAKGLPEGDLTPITFANLAACGSALIVREVGDDDYSVLFDRRLAQGIPCFFNLSARLIWDYRQLTRSGRGVPFKVGFLPTRSIDADACFDESVDVVPGAQDDILVMDVDCAPEISIVAKQSGLRLDTLKACLNTLDPERFAEIEGSPSDIAIGTPTESMMEDSELFQALMLQEVRAMPRCYAIEGTGYKGRAERVEAMKPGDPVILESDWQCEYFDPVGIEVFNAENQTLGYLSLDLSEGASAVGGFRQLACMLPYVVATVDSVTPVSARGRGAKYPLMDIRVELIDEALDRSVEPAQLTAEALDACKTMFSLPPEASGACSILLPDGGESKEDTEQGDVRFVSLDTHSDFSDRKNAFKAEGSPDDSSARNLPEGRVENRIESMADAHKSVEQSNRTEKKSAAIDIEVARERGLAVVRELAPKLEEHIESRLAEKRRLSSELSSLGLFKFAEKKAKKAEIAEVGRSVHRWCMLRIAWGEVENWLRICDLAGNYKARKERFREFTSEADVENKTKFILLSSSVLLYMADMKRPVASEEVGKFIVNLTGNAGYKRERIMEWLVDEHYVRRIEVSKDCAYELILGGLDAGSYFLEDPCHQINFMIQDVFSEYDKFDWENSVWRY